MSIGSFILVKNEMAWIQSHIENVAPYLDEMVFFDGKSTDGTLEYLLNVQKKYPHIKVFKNKDSVGLKDDYTALFNECLHKLKTDWAIFLHPDMWIENPERLREIRSMPGIAMSMRIESYGGNPDSQLYRIKTGRCELWKNIYRLHEPDLGAHYHGWYGASNEDVYFSAITGDSHRFYGSDFEKYPYEVVDSGLKAHHFSDVRSYGRRLGRMISILTNQGCPTSRAVELAKLHPRVTLVPSETFVLESCADPRLAQVNSCTR